MRRVLAGERGAMWVDGQPANRRGRSGRTWASAPGNLLASLLIKTGCPQARAGQLSLVAGVAVREGIRELPTIGDGRQSGTSNAPSILNASPEAAAGGGLALLKTGDRLVIDLDARTANADVPAEEWEQRRKETTFEVPASQTPWQELYREKVGSLATGMCFDFAVAYDKVRRHLPRHSH